MPFRLPFNFPFPYRYPNYNTFYQAQNYGIRKNSLSQFGLDLNGKKPFLENLKSSQYNQNSINFNNFDQKNETTENDNSSEAFFEIFGLKLYFDDILIIFLLFILYDEKVQDVELFICLILLLLN